MVYYRHMEILAKTKQSMRETNKQIISQGLGLVSSAFVLVAGLAWNDAVRSLIGRYFKAGSGIISQFIYAILVTIIAVIITVRLNNLAQKFKE